MYVSWEGPVAFLLLKTEDMILFRTVSPSDILEGSDVLQQTTAARDNSNTTTTLPGSEQSSPPPHSVAPDIFLPSTPLHSRQRQEPI